MWRIGWANNASKWQMGLNYSAFRGLKTTQEDKSLVVVRVRQQATNTSTITWHITRNYITYLVSEPHPDIGESQGLCYNTLHYRKVQKLRSAVQLLQCRTQATSHPENQFQPACQLMTTVTQFQKPGARDANNSNPVSNMPMVMKFYTKKKSNFT